MNPPTSFRTYPWWSPVAMGLAAVIVAGLVDVACPRKAGAEEPAIKRITVTPQVGFAPLKVRISVVVPHHVDNFSLCLHVSGPIREDHSCQPHTAQSLSERLMTLILPADGDYLVWAELHRINNRSYPSSAVDVRVGSPRETDF